jgi:transcriptional regulator with XRE-family HTH domain
MSTRRIMATRLRALRARRKLSQRGLAEVSGVSREYIARIELGQHDPTVSTLVKLAKALGVKPGRLLD